MYKECCFRCVLIAVIEYGSRSFSYNLQMSREMGLVINESALNGIGIGRNTDCILAVFVVS